MDLEELKDRMEIRAVAELYMACLDRRDWDGLSDVFTDDVRYEAFGGLTVATGLEDVVSLLKNVEIFACTNHHLCNVWINLKGDEAEVECSVVANVVLGQIDGGEVLTRGGRYVDRFVRTPKGWRLAYRSQEPLWQTNETSRVADTIRSPAWRAAGSRG